jgi:hypothetical protein
VEAREETFDFPSSADTAHRPSAKEMHIAVNRVVATDVPSSPKKALSTTNVNRG